MRANGRRKYRVAYCPDLVRREGFEKGDGISNHADNDSETLVKVYEVACMFAEGFLRQPLVADCWVEIHFVLSWAHQWQ